MALPLCSAFGTFNPYLVTVTIPGGTCPGLYTVVGTATVTFGDGTVLTQTGDTVICLVPSAPGRPGVPRLDLKLLTPSFPRMAPGDTHVAQYLVINNDQNNSVSLTAFATSKQMAVRPQGANELQGVFTVSSPFGDDFPIVFSNAPNCITLPSHPYTQPMISNALPVIPPLGTNIVSVAIRSYGQCASGSCSESTLRLMGTFSDGSNALACAGMAFSVDTSVPSQNCGTLVNDCNHNGIPDAVDIANRTSQDLNYNAMPDECEGQTDTPNFASVSPTSVAPGGSLQVQVAFNEIFPMSNVWANGSSLMPTQFFGSPLWIGTIPADTRPGPQTVYFLGKDNRGILSSYIATYTVLTPPSITQQPQSQVALLGQNATFNVVATGSPTLTYQWRANGAALAGATTNSLTVFNVQPGTIGYSVVVANSVGSVTSVVANLTVEPQQYLTAIVPSDGTTVSSMLTENDETAGIGLKCIITNAQWVREWDWGLTETTPTNGVSSLSDLLLLRNEGTNASVIFISDSPGGTLLPPRPNLLLVAEYGLEQFLADLVLKQTTSATAKITVLDDSATSSDTLSVQVVPQIPPSYKTALVTNGFGTATLTESEETAGIAIKCIIPNAQWLREVDWGSPKPRRPTAPAVSAICSCSETREPTLQLSSSATAPVRR
jgi:hypothetical protein